MKNFLVDILSYRLMVFLMKATCSLLLISHFFGIVYLIDPLIYLLAILGVPWFIHYC